MCRGGLKLKERGRAYHHSMRSAGIDSEYDEEREERQRDTVEKQQEKGTLKIDRGSVGMGMGICAGGRVVNMDARETTAKWNARESERVSGGAEASRPKANSAKQRPLIMCDARVKGYNPISYSVP